MIGMTHHVKTAPPVKITSVKFMAVSIATIEMKDIPVAVLKAFLKPICLLNIKVSKRIEVIKPFAIASIIIAKTGQIIPINWK